MPSPEHTSATEWFTESQRELRASPRKPQCLFSGLEDFHQPNVRDLLDQFKSSGQDVTYGSLAPVVKTGKKRCNSAPAA
eukprot:10735325-Alexandrium_andersonii.AAC.1